MKPHRENLMKCGCCYKRALDKRKDEQHEILAGLTDAQNEIDDALKVEEEEECNSSHST